MLLKKIKKIIIIVFAFFLTSGTLIVSAAFIETLITAANSNQDSPQNILGANNSNNDFNSSSVVPNQDGSIIEMTEYIINNL